MQKLIVVVTGGQSEESTTNRLGEGLASAVVDEGRSVGADVRVETISVRDLAHEIASASVTGFATGDLQTAIDLVGEADAVIAVSPTYRASYTGLFKAFWDVTPDGIIAGVPMIVGATGGTPRHSLVTDTAMRPLFAYLKALVMPTAVYAAADDWAGGSLTSRMRNRLLPVPRTPRARSARRGRARRIRSKTFRPWRPCCVSSCASPRATEA